MMSRIDRRIAGIIRRPAGGRKEGESMRRATILALMALMLVALLVPAVGVAHAGSKSDQQVPQAP